MEQRCTCGVVLPPDARFCHKCGKPQYEEDVARLAAQEAEPVVTPVLGNTSKGWLFKGPVANGSAAPVGFGNMRAIWTTLVVAALAFVCMTLASLVAPPFVPVVLCAAGFVAARFYSSRNSQLITPLGGAVLGLMTGLWLFLVFALVLGFGSAMATATLATPEGQQAFKGLSSRVTPEVLKAFQDPHQMVVTFLVPMFFLLIVSSAFGGMLAAHFQSRRRPS